MSYHVSFHYHIVLYRFLQAKLLLDKYIGQVLYEAIMSTPTTVIFDPLYFYANYLLWKIQQSHAKTEKLIAADSILAFRLFIPLANKFIQNDDNCDEQLFSMGLLKPPEGNKEEEEDDAYAELIPPPGPDDPETLWNIAKKNFKLSSLAMDKLMMLAGLKKVKDRAVTVAMEVLTKNQRPVDQKPPTMNFLFVVSTVQYSTL